MPEEPTATRNRNRRRVVPLSLYLAGAFVILIALAAGAYVLADASSWSGARDEQEATLEAARDAFAEGKYEDSESVLAALVAEDPEDLEARKALAESLAAQGKNEEAIEQYKAIVELDSEDHESLYAMATIEQLLGMATDAIAHLEAAIAVEPEPSYYAALAPIHATVGKWTECIGAWTTYLELAELDPADEGQVHAAMAVAYDGMRDYDGAKAELQRALFLDPNNESYQLRLESYGD